MGFAFASVVDSFTNVVLGAISFPAGGEVTFDRLGVHRGTEIVIPYGAFLTAVVNLLIVAAALFATRCPNCTSRLEARPA